MVKKLRELNYTVHLIMNPSRVELDQLFKDLISRMEENAKANKRNLLHFYYTGHGKMKDTTYAVLNETTFKKALFPFERKIGTLSLCKNTCVYALLDCCRQ